MAIEPIAMLDLSAERELIGPEIEHAIQEVIASGQYINGWQVRQFELEVANYLGVAHAVGLNSGTDALVLALDALGIGPGDEVITTPFSFVASAEAICRVGAMPRFADICPGSYLLDLGSVESLITPQTRAIIPVHLFGRVANMQALLKLASRTQIHVVEDVAQAFGAEQIGQKAGTLGTFGAFSCFPSKPLGAYGDAGLLVTNDEQLAQRARQLARHGSKVKYCSEQIGYNSRLDELQAAVLRIKLGYVDQWNQQRNQVAKHYLERLAAWGSRLQIPTGTWPAHVFHQYTLSTSPHLRDTLKLFLQQRQIASMVYYPTLICDMPAYAHFASPNDCPRARQATQSVLSLPISPFLTAAQIDRVCCAITECLANSPDESQPGTPL